MSNNDNWKKQAVDLALEGYSWREVARTIGKSKSTVSDYLRKHFSEVANKVTSEDVVGPKILFLDLEVSASVVAAFSMFRHFSTPDHVMEFPYVLSFALNWAHEDANEVYSKSLADYPLFNVDHKSDYELICELWKFLDEADLVVIQNESFDRGWFTQRCAYYDIAEPSPYRVVCTLKGLKKAMSLPSNSLGYTTKYFNLNYNKLQHEGISLWIRCMEGEVEALKLMEEYNRGDIPTLRELYYKIRAYIPNHPNLSLYYPYDGDMRCGVCGSKELEELDRLAYTNLSAYTSYRCTDCGTVRRGGVSQTTTEERKNMTRTIVK